MMTIWLTGATPHVDSGLLVKPFDVEAGRGWLGVELVDGEQIRIHASAIIAWRHEKQEWRYETRRNSE